jgi:diacylglycerol kinase family enzyme
MPKPVLLVNPRSGGGDATPELLRAAEARGIETVVLRPGAEPEPPAADVLGVAGGDGSLGAGARIALERGIPFVCVPFGTRNHFARDVGLDVDDPVGALDAFAGARERTIDVGRANDRVFLNNVSIGAYARFVHGHIRAVWRTQRVLLDGAPVKARVVLFANNAYSANGSRDRLDEGLLHLYVAHGLLHTTWEERTGTRFVVEGSRQVAIDGEPLHVELPLEIAIEPRALRVLLP